jgi:hypothetical protein
MARNKRRNPSPESKTAGSLAWEYGGFWWLCKKVSLLLSAGAALAGIILSILDIRTASSVGWNIIIIIVGILLVGLGLQYAGKYRVSIAKALMPLLISTIYLILTLIYLGII